MKQKSIISQYPSMSRKGLYRIGFWIAKILHYPNNYFFQGSKRIIIDDRIDSLNVEDEQIPIKNKC